jgi:hypothetical protein
VQGEKGGHQHQETSTSNDLSHTSFFHLLSFSSSVESWPALKQIIVTGRVSAWACPLLVDTLLSVVQKPGSRTTSKKTKALMKRREQERIQLFELTFSHVRTQKDPAPFCFVFVWTTLYFLI